MGSPALLRDREDGGIMGLCGRGSHLHDEPELSLSPGRQGLYSPREGAHQPVPDLE